MHKPTSMQGGDHFKQQHSIRTVAVRDDLQAGVEFGEKRLQFVEGRVEMSLGLAAMALPGAC